MNIENIRAASNINSVNIVSQYMQFTASNSGTNNVEQIALLAEENVAKTNGRGPIFYGVSCA